MSSNRCLPSFYARLCCVVELWKVIQGAWSCKEGALQHVRGILCRENAYTCCVSIEVLPFLPLLLAACVHSLLRHLHIVHDQSCPLARLSSRLTEVRWGVLFVILSHSLHLMTLGRKFAGFTECRKQISTVSRLGFAREKSGFRLFLVWLSLL